MADKDYRMKIHVDGDNRGFKKTLNQTSRDIERFEQKQSSGLSGVLQGAGLIGGALGYRRLLLSGLARATGVKGGNPGPAAFGVQGLLGASLGSPDIKKWYAHHKRRSVLMKARQERAQEKITGMMHYGLHGPGLLPHHKQQLKEARKRRRIAKYAGAQSMGYTKGVEIAGKLRTFMMGAVPLAAITAAAAAAALKLGSAQAKQLKESTAFSAPVLRHQALLDVSTLKYQMKLAKNPMFMGQQQRLLDAKYNAKMAGGPGIGYITTEAEILWNRIVEGIKDIYSAATGADAITSEGVVY